MRSIKNIILPVLLLLLAGQMLSAQNLRDNPDYRKSVELRRQSDIAFEEGDYPEAKRLAEESQKYARLSDEWIAMMLKRYKANSALRRFETAMHSARNISGETNFPEEWAKASSLYETAKAQFGDEDYENSYESSLEGIEVLSAIVYIPRAGYNGPWPAKYEVRKLPAGSEDCLWNIAGYDFVYGDSWQWKRLYEANRDKLPEPANPRLILPGMILDIPSENGELRSGTWKDGRIQ